MWLFIGCGLRDLVPLVGSLSVLVTVRVYAGGPSAVVFLLGYFLVVWKITALGPPTFTRTITKTERLPTKGTRSRNPQPINKHIIVQY